MENNTQINPEVYWTSMWLNDVEEIALENGYTLDEIEPVFYRNLPRPIKQAINRRIDAGIPAHVKSFKE